jgi:allophanate hydrolase subunit 1
MSDTISAEEFKALHQGANRSTVVVLQPKDDRAARLRGHLRAMGAYYNVPKEQVEEYIQIHVMYKVSIAANLKVFAALVGIPQGPASFYIRQSELSGTI